MGSLAVLTPTYRPDLEAALLLHESVLRHTSSSTLHHMVVPPADVALFRSQGSARLRVHSTSDFLPRSWISTYLPRLSTRRPGLWSKVAKIQAVNPRRPWPPIRGWILQQVVKLAAAAALDSQVVLIADSDVALLQHVELETFHRDGVTRLYRSEGAIDDSMRQHLSWHEAAERLLGAQASSTRRQVDYIAPLLPWNTDLVRALKNVVESRSDGDWRAEMAAERGFSECMLYGRYVDEIALPSHRSWSVPDHGCHIYWDQRPLNRGSAVELLRGIGPGTLALCIQSVSVTGRLARQQAVEEAERRVHGS